MTDMNSNPRSYLDCIEAGCQAWQRGDDESGRQWLQRACLLWLESLRASEPSATDGDGMLVSPAALRTMEQILLQLQREDMAAAIDKLAYELLPELRAQMAAQDDSGAARRGQEAHDTQDAQDVCSGTAPCLGVGEEEAQRGNGTRVAKGEGQR
ncbi:hypothetical protein PA598K_03531 [Paenibacillus sp. 598K]|uniref:hypothetical protein n=1 Tax=Paenibacillus sp. 598K TaxID=1117987 RepID=UPI000FFA5AAF|nr:hypothetical protein [Paenibacillus sp. 598K]GBF75146.1 hypothetical protein PA598K_03531 [Paenibacillus sp. 598K]